MRILSVVRKNYYGVPTAIEPMHVYFTMPLKEMGHEVDTFDHYTLFFIRRRVRNLWRP